MTCGIYQIKNNINGKIYIGSAKNIETRWRRHKSDLANKKHGNSHLQCAYDLYGEDAFTFSILRVTTIEDLLDFEQLYIEEIPKEQRYNIREYVNRNDGIKWSETRDLSYLKNPLTDKQIKALEQGREIGRSLPKSKKHIESARKLARIQGKKNANKDYIFLDKFGNWHDVKNLSEFARLHGVNPANLHALIRGDRNYCGIFVKGHRL